jgi:arsenate reductase
MTKAIIYHNPRCSKSRQALGLLEADVESLEIIEYLKTGLNRNQVEEMVSLLDGEVADLIRTNEDLFKSAPFDTQKSEDVIDGLIKNPKILQRPVVILKGKAIVARPPEKVRDLL